MLTTADVLAQCRERGTPIERYLIDRARADGLITSIRTAAGLHLYDPSVVDVIIELARAPKKCGRKSKHRSEWVEVA